MKKGIIATLFLSTNFLVFGMASPAFADTLTVSVANPLATTATARGYFLTLINERSVNIDITPLPGGATGTGINEVNILTNAPTGYRLYLSSDQAADYAEDKPGNALYRNNNTSDYFLPPTDGTIITDNITGVMTGASAELTANSWGFNISANDTTPDTFAAIPLSANSQLIKQTSGPETNPDQEDSRIYIHYGAKATPSKPAGTYTGKVIYTAVADAAPAKEAEAVPSTTSNFSGGDTIRISTSLFGIIDDIDLSGVAVSIRNTTSGDTYSCAPTAIDTDDDVISVSCALPEVPALERTYDVTASIAKYDWSYTIENGLTYVYDNAMDTISTMQAMTTSICSSTTTPAAFNEDGTINANVPQSILSDIRNDQGYTVRKLADGNCWMSDDLYLPLATGTAVVGSKNDRSTFSFTPTSCSANGSCAMDGNTKRYNGKWHYNWYAATAGQGKSNSVNVDIDGSICPVGWRLPASSYVRPEISFARMAYIYGFISEEEVTKRDSTTRNSAATAFKEAPFNFNQSGIMISGSISYSGNHSYIGSTAHASSSDRAYGYTPVTIGSDTPLITPNSINGQKFHGIFVRCIAL